MNKFWQQTTIFLRDTLPAVDMALEVHHIPMEKRRPLVVALILAVIEQFADREQIIADHGYKKINIIVDEIYHKLYGEKNNVTVQRSGNDGR